MKPIDQIIIEFFQERSSSEEINKLNNWSESPANKKELNDYSKIWLWTHQLIERKPQIEFEDTWQKINDWVNTKNSGTIWLQNLAKYAAIILIVLNVGWWGAHFYYETGASAGQYFQVSADQAANSVIVLPDSTMVYLRQGSNLKYDPQFKDGNREVSLEGEAYFEVSGNKDHPFIVKTEQAQIKVLGTQFNVSAEKGSPICQTTLVEGKVEFITQSGKKYLLLPNQMIEMDVNKKDVRIKRVNTELYTAWKDGKIIFRDETLGEITQKLERIYHVNFIFNNPDLAEEYRFSGTFYRETPIGDVITMLKLSIPMTVTREEKFPDPDKIYLK
ncbi:MAG: hypothetical protein A2W90_00355 [Bacteroidetes bacterium GWF2_42_66]|nr:MAG: hypothetical protein A2W92_18960 [Bacteroidetes bacterium GWA2_42_15]OFY02076.1 MAG: hypothetical protein A2W89_11545 [Bacteroidetes bacterium GWE2_42_39]OFY43422.1 MAG: hypothetical protein A2W90_00355 [Bacteroidetes bacterium GWF2_42_66]HBL76506.1 hypothetical protein [Prolixibacteraceae bacterium]HCU63801.1 hypothetical protein [Prolixibacteraceae bacterium]